ncbi:MAG: DUF4011 domain-containing protein [Gemmatimonadota bacterium]
MLGEGYSRPAAGRDTHVRSAIGRWRDGLIDAAAASALLSATPGADGVITIVRPPAGEVIARLAAGGAFTLRPRTGGLDGAAPRPGPGVLDTDQDPTSLAVTARQLTLRPGPDDPGGGEGALYLAAGALTWAGEGQARRTSPLLLVPVRLTAAGDGDLPVLAPAADGPLVNPALARELGRYRVTLPPVRDLDEVALARLLEAAVDAAAAREGWRVTGTLLLSWFPFPSGATYQDLLDNEALAAAHPAVRALADGRPAGGEREFSRPAAGPEIGGWTAPDTAPLILAADSAQRACVAAALAGRPLVMEGAAGTGRRQTVANMIGALLHAGQTVLFVSPDAAGGGAVTERLARAGLGPYLLELGTRAAASAEVAAELAGALDTQPAGPAAPGLDQDARQRLGQFSAYTGAMKRSRPPLGYSLHDVIGMVASVRDIPAPPAAGPAPASLTAAVFGEIRQAAAALAAAWRPAAEGRSFPWRGVTARGSQDERLYQAASALEELAGMVRVNQTLADVTGLTRPSSAPALAALLDHLWGWPEGMPDGWLTMESLDAVEVAVTQLAGALTAITAREGKAAQAAGGDWRTIPRPDALPAVDTRALAGLAPACADPAELTAGQIGGLARSFSAAADQLDKRLGTLANLASMLGMPAPVTFSDAADLLTLAHLAEEPDRPERSWLSIPGQQAAYEAGRTLYEAHRALAAAAAEASAYYTADVLNHDAGGLAQRLGQEVNRLSRLSGDYRADRRTVAAFTREGVSPETAVEHLALAAAWEHAASSLTAAEARYGAHLGPYYAGQATDFDRLGRALTHAATAVRSARGHDLSRAAEHISRDAVPKPVITSTVAEIRQDLAAWQATLAAPPAVAARPELINGGIAAAAEWLRAHLAPLQSARAFTERMGEAAGRQLTFGQARQLVALREAADTAHAELTSRKAVFTELCGRLYAGTQTDVAALSAALEWARGLRTMITGGPGPLTPAHLKAAESAVPTAGLAEAAAAWQQACASLADAFGPERRHDLAAELDEYEDGTAVLEAMFNDAGGRDEWHAYQAARAALTVYGLAEAADFCAAQHVAAGRVAQVIEGAVLQGWAEYQLRTAPDLAAFRAADRGALLRDYLELDAALQSAAAGTIVRACNARRAQADDGESSLLRREAGKAADHAGRAGAGPAEPPLPVRELLERTRRTVQAVKPCLVTSAHGASRYLPADLHFDVVIIGDADQLSPAEAAACLYRGSAAVLVAQPAGPGRPAAPVPAVAAASGVYEHIGLSWRYAAGE